MNNVSKLWAFKIEIGKASIKDVPDGILDEVTQILLNDGYSIENNGEVVPEK